MTPVDNEELATLSPIQPEANKHARPPSTTGGLLRAYPRAIVATSRPERHRERGTREPITNQPRLKHQHLATLPPTPHITPLHVAPRA